MKKIIVLGSILILLVLAFSMRTTVETQLYNSQISEILRRISRLEGWLNGAPIGTAKIQDAAITNAKIASLTWNKAQGGEAILGGVANGNGLLKVRDEAANDVVILDKNGVAINSGKLTIKDANNSTVIDANGINSGNFPYANVYSNAGFSVSTNSFSWVDVPSMSLTFNLPKASTLMILVFAQMHSSRTGAQTSWVRLGLDIDGSVVNYVGHENYDSTSGGIVTNADTNSFHYVVALAAGTHTIKMRASTDGLSTNGYVDSRGLSYIVLGR